MDDNKDNTPEKDKEEPLGSTFDKNTEDVKNEMEELAATFQRELDKTKSEADEKGELIQDLEDIPEKSAKDAENEDIPEEQLCECCGEKRRGTEDNPDSPYCDECDEGLRHYPFNFLNVFFVVVILALVFYSGYIFASHMSVISEVYKADKYVSEKKMTSALDAYSTAANSMVNSNIKGEMVYKREILAAYSMGYMQDIGDLSSNFNSWEMKLPHLKKANDALLDASNFIATAQAAYSIISQYGTTTTAELPYDSIISDLTALETSTLPDETTTVSDGSTTTTTSSSYSAKATQYNMAMIYFYKYYVALICDKDTSVQIEYLEKIKSEYPDYVWLYASPLGDIYAKTGKDVTEICNLMTAENVEDFSPTILQMESMRIQGNFDDAISFGGKAISENSDNEMSYEIYRQAALCYLAKGEYDNAFSAASNAYSAYSYSIEVIDTLALCSALTGDEDTYNDMGTILTENGYSLSSDVTGFKTGAITLDDILTKGDYDVE